MGGRSCLSLWRMSMPWSAKRRPSTPMLRPTQLPCIQRHRYFPCCRNGLSTDLTSLGEDVERLALIIDMTVTSDGSVVAGDVYRAVVVKKAKLAYNTLC